MERYNALNSNISVSEILLWFSVFCLSQLFAVKKLDKRASEQQQDHEFIELVNNIDMIRHSNIVELVGYCAEHDQRLLVYEYCSNGTLQDGLHSDDEFKKKLSWNTRVSMALGAARALE